MEKIGYSLIDATGVELQKFGDAKGQEYPMPSVITLANGDQVMGFSLGEVLADGSRIVERWLDDSPAEPYYTQAGRTVAFDGEKVVVTQHYDVTEPPIIEPQALVVSPYQARVALLNAGLLDTVESAISDKGGKIKIKWDYATEVRSDDADLLELATDLGIAAQIPALFQAAQQVT